MSRLAAGTTSAIGHGRTGSHWSEISAPTPGFRDHQDLSTAQLEAWVDRLVRLDWEGRTVELTNLPERSRPRLDNTIVAVLGPGWRAPDVVERCPPILRRHDLGRTARQEALLARVQVPDNYSLIKHVLGLYPLTVIPVALAWQRWEAKHLLPIRTPTAELDFAGAPVPYLPDPMPEARRQPIRRNPRPRHTGDESFSSEGERRV